MTTTPRVPSGRIYTFQCESGRYVVYNAAEINNPFDHEPNKWYILPYPVPPGLSAGKAFESAEEAEGSVRIPQAATNGDGVPASPPAAVMAPLRA